MSTLVKAVVVWLALFVGLIASAYILYGIMLMVEMEYLVLIIAGIIALLLTMKWCAQ